MDLAQHQEMPTWSFSSLLKRAGLLALVVLMNAPVTNFAHAARLCRDVYVPAAPARPTRLASIRTQAEMKARVLEIFKDGAKEFAFADAFAREVRMLPERKQEKWLSAIGEVYRDVPKKRLDPLAPWHIGGRRLLDRALHLLQGWDLGIAELVARRGNREAFLEAIDRQTAMFRSDYGSREVWNIAISLQAFLREREAARTSPGPTPSFLLAGSFLNGRGRLGASDLDLTVSDPLMVRAQAEIAARVNAALAETRPGQTLPVEMHGEPAAFYGKINPFVLEIRPDGFQLHVFEPGRFVSADQIMTGSVRSYPF